MVGRRIRTHSAPEIDNLQRRTARRGDREGARDGATLCLKARIDPGQPVATGASVVQAFELRDRLQLHFSQGPPAAFTLTNPGNAVAVRDATGRVVYRFTLAMLREYRQTQGTNRRGDG